MKKIFGMLVVMLMLIGCGKESVNSEVTQGQEERYVRISQDEAKKIMDTENGIVILDVRTPKEYSEGYIPNAINLPNEDISDKEIEILPDKNQKILVYCRSGKRSTQAAKKLSKLGYNNIYEFDGIINWKYEIVK